MENMNDYLSENNNLRCVWNALPQNRLDKERYIVPLGFHYTPLKQVENLQLLEYEPILCSNCQSVLNPYCYLDFKSKAWECMFCMKKNLFPGHYAQHISESTLPPEVMNENSSVEYKLEKKGLANYPVIFFLIDITIEQEELIFLKDKLLNVIENLPDETLIGVITFGTMASLLEIGFTEFQKMHVFRGDKEYSAQEIQELLLVTAGSDPLLKGGNAKHMGKKFLQPKKDCAFNLSTFLDELTTDQFPRGNVERNKNCAGLALHIAVSLLETICNGDPCRIEFFLGGPPNIGLGKIVGLSQTETIRAFVDFQKGSTNTKYFKSAVEFYQNISTRAYKAGQIIDLFCCSFNQVGLTEMKSCTEKTGGIMVLSDSFGTPQFKESLAKIFELDENSDFKMCFRGKIDVFVTKPFTLQGGLGYMVSVDPKNQKTLEMISKDVFGQGNTRVWNLGGMNQNSTYTFLLDINNENTSYNCKRAVCQLVTSYIAGDRTHRMRVTTFCRKTVGEFNSSILEIAQSFDQDAATVMLGKYCVDLGYRQENIETLRWLDKVIIRLVTKFSEYKKDDVHSFRLNNKFQMFPQFMYYLRRSPFISDFNSSMDESIYYKSTLIKENLINGTIMIQPLLYTYSAETPDPQAVHLDISCMKDDVVLLADAYFFICVWHGSTVCSWREKGMQDDPDYENVKNMLELPQEYAQELLSDRLPVPKFVSCDANTGQERYIKFLVNPSCGDSEQNSGIPEGYYTNDVSLKTFWEHLKRKVVQT